MASKLYDRVQKKWVFPSDAETDEAIKSGNFAFAQGESVPVIAPDGSMGTLPAEDVHRAFTQHGFRWATQADKDTRNEEAQKALIREHSPSAAQAFVLGGIRGAVPLADPIMQGMGYLHSGAQGAEAVTEGLNQAKELHPYASGAGALVGAIASPIPVKMGGAVSARAESLAASAGVGSKILQRGAGAAGEGAFFGLWDGLSEASLGKPEDAVEHIFTGIENGAIFGGGVGLGLGAASKAAAKTKQIFHDATNLAGKAASKVTEFGQKSLLRPVTEDAVMADIDALTVDDATKAWLTDALNTGGVEKYKAAKRQIASAERQTSRDLDYAGRNLDRDTKNFPKQIQKSVNGVLKEAGNDITKALNLAHEEYRGANAVLEGSLVRDVGPGEMADDVLDTVERMRAGLKTGESTAQSFRAEMGSQIEAKLSSKGITSEMYAEARKTGSSLQGSFNAGQEVDLAREWRRQIKEKLAKEGLPPPMRKTLEQAESRLDDALYGHTRYGEQLKELDHTYNTMEALRSASSGTGVRVQGRVIPAEKWKAKLGVLGKLHGDPELAQDFNKLLNNFDQVTPIASALNKSRDALEQGRLRDDLQAAIKATIGEGYTGRLTADNVLDLIDTLHLPTDLTHRATELKRLQDEFKTLGSLSVQDKALRLQNTFGQSITPELHGVLQHAKHYEALTRVMGQNVNPDVLTRMTRSAGRSFARSVVGGAVGSMFGSPVLGASIGAAAGSLLTGATNPYIAVKNIARMSSLISKTKARTDAAFDAAVHSFIETNKGQSKSIVGFLSSTNNLPLQKRRETFKERGALLQSYKGDPHLLAEAASERVGSVSGAPQISAAANAQYIKNVQFLAQKLPQDPLAHRQMFANRSKWEPSDFELAKFERFSDAVEHPLSVVARVAQGTVSPEEIETLKTCYPGIYSRLQEKVMDAIIDHDSELPYQKRLLLGQLFNVPTDMTLDPNFVAAMQANWAPKEKGGRPEGGASSASTSSGFSSKKMSLDLASRESPTSRITQR